MTFGRPINNGALSPCREWTYHCNFKLRSLLQSICLAPFLTWIIFSFYSSSSDKNYQEQPRIFISRFIDQQCSAFEQICFIIEINTIFDPNSARDRGELIWQCKEGTQIYPPWLVLDFFTRIHIMIGWFVSADTGRSIQCHQAHVLQKHQGDEWSEISIFYCRCNTEHPALRLLTESEIRTYLFHWRTKNDKLVPWTTVRGPVVVPLLTTVYWWKGNIDRDCNKYWFPPPLSWMEVWIFLCKSPVVFDKWGSFRSWPWTFRCYWNMDAKSNQTGYNILVRTCIPVEIRPKVN